jgi:hypothetical protein
MPIPVSDKLYTRPEMLAVLHHQPNPKIECKIKRARGFTRNRLNSLREKMGLPAADKKRTQKRWEWKYYRKGERGKKQDDCETVTVDRDATW